MHPTACEQVEHVVCVAGRWGLSWGRVEVAVSCGRKSTYPPPNLFDDTSIATRAFDMNHRALSLIRSKHFKTKAVGKNKNVVDKGLPIRSDKQHWGLEAAANQSWKHTQLLLKWAMNEGKAKKQGVAYDAFERPPIRARGASRRNKKSSCSTQVTE